MIEGGSLLVSPGDVAPSSDEVEVVGVSNPGAVDVNGVVHFLLRVAERPRDKRPGWLALPVAGPRGYAVDWVRDRDVDVLDPRGVARRSDGRHRLLTLSHLRLATSRDGSRLDWISSRPTLASAAPYEAWGIEDARIVPMGDQFFVTYVAVSPDGIATALARTAAFDNFERLGVIFPAENKNVVLFPRQIGGQFVALHRPSGSTPLGPPGIWLARSPDLLHWGQHLPLPIRDHDARVLRTGAGSPPIETPEGWLLIYHRVALDAYRVGRYDAHALLLDLDDPARIVAIRPAPLLARRKRAANPLGGVIFPSGIIHRGDELLIYAGEGDVRTVVHRVRANGVVPLPAIAPSP